MGGHYQNNARAVLFSLRIFSGRAVFSVRANHARRSLVWPPLLGTCDGEGKGWQRQSSALMPRRYAVVPPGP